MTHRPPHLQSVAARPPLNAPADRITDARDKPSYSVEAGEAGQPILDLGRQDAYADYRRRWRNEVFLPYLAKRELPGTPVMKEGLP